MVQGVLSVSNPIQHFVATPQPDGTTRVHVEAGEEWVGDFEIIAHPRIVALELLLAELHEAAVDEKLDYIIGATRPFAK